MIILRFLRVPTIYVLEQKKEKMYTPINPCFTIPKRGVTGIHYTDMLARCAFVGQHSRLNWRSHDKTYMHGIISGHRRALTMTLPKKLGYQSVKPMLPMIKETMPRLLISCTH